MSSETFTTALFLITAVIAAGVLINAIFPVVYQMSGTFSSSTHNADLRIRTDFTVVTTFANSTTVKVWMKNVGTNKIVNSELKKSSVFSGDASDFEGYTWESGRWDFKVNDEEFNQGDWGIGDTLEIIATPTPMPGSGGEVYFQFVLPNGISRSITFTRTT